LGEDAMIVVNVPRLLEKNQFNATDLMRKGNIAYATALRLSKGEASAISFDVLNNLCELFQVGVGEILEYRPDPKEPPK
jgi:DNA-binding Xre family transcriptional regulator